MSYNLLKKSLVIAIILLFLGVAFAPSINANVPKEEYVEITTEIYGINGIKPQTVKLTKEESIEIEQLIDNIKFRLDKAETKEEIIEIFKDSIIEFMKYGLLNDISANELYNLVCYHDEYSIESGTLTLFLKEEMDINKNTNIACLISGETDETNIRGLASILTAIISYSTFGTFYLVSELVFPKLNDFFENNPIILSLLNRIKNPILTSLLLLALYPPILLPFELSGIISIGRFVFNIFEGSFEPRPAKGWVSTYGLNGKRDWEGEFYGQEIHPFIPFGNIGAIHFTGLKINLDPFYLPVWTSKYFYLGKALYVHLDYNITLK